MSSRRSPLPKTISIMVFLFLLGTLQACGLPEEQGGTDGSSSDLDSDSDTARDPDLTLGKTLIINAERLDGSTDLSLGQISLVSLNADFNETSDGNLPTWDVTRLEDSSNIQMFIESDYIEQINHVIKIRYSDDEIYYAAIPYIPIAVNSTAQVTTNIFTHYLLKKVFDQIPDSSALLTHQPCLTDNPVIGCDNQPRAKQDYLSMINNAVGEFNFELSNNNNISQAIETLEQQDEIRHYVEVAATELTRATSPFAKGTMREVTGLGFDENGDVFSTPPPLPKTYNSAFLALSLSDINATNRSVESIGFAASNSTIVENRELANELPAYPKYQSTTYLTDLRRESALFIDIPYERTSLTVRDINDSDIDRSEPINAYASASTPDSFLSREGNILEARTLSPSQPGDVTDTKDVAWQYEPIFAKLYQVNEYEPDSVYSPVEEEEDIDYGNEPTWLTGGNFSKAANYIVKNPNTEDEELGDQIEDINLFSWEVHAQQTPSTFSTSLLNGKSYGVISFSQKLNDTDKIIEIFGETMIWNASGNLFSLEQPINNLHYRSHTLARLANNNSQSLTTQRGIIEDSRRFFSELSEVSDPSSETGISEVNRGILKLDGGLEAPIGHATESGSHFAFSFNTSDTTVTTDRGTGIILGVELEEVSSPIFPDTDDVIQFTYHIQGNSMTILDETNSLQNLNGSTLHITDRLNAGSSNDCHATLQLSRIYVTHTLTSNPETNSLSSPNQDSQASVESDTCRVTFNEIEISFADVLGQALTLKGFISKSDDSATPGNLLTLLWLQENSIGLVLAGKDQILKPGFE